MKLVDNAASLAVVMLLSEEDLNPPAYGTVSLIDAEVNQSYDLQVKPDVVALYQERLENHISLWKDTAARMNVKHVVLKAEDVIEGELEGLLEAEILGHDQ